MSRDTFPSGKVEEAAKEGDLAKTRRLVDKIDDESVYKKGAQARVDGLEKQIIEDRKTRAAAAKAAGRCPDVEKMIAQARAEGPNVVEAVSQPC